VLVAAATDRAPSEAQLRGHGGPIRALAVSADGMTALSGSFDASAIRWSLRDSADGSADAAAVGPNYLLTRAHCRIVVD
jgi:WD40 repeat protein